MEVVPAMSLVIIISDVISNVISNVIRDVIRDVISDVIKNVLHHMTVVYVVKNAVHVHPLP